MGRRAAVIDGVAGAVLAVAGAVQVADDPPGGITPLVMLAAAISGGAIAWRRTAPDVAVIQAVTPVAVAALFGIDLTSLMATFLAAIITTASFALHSRRPRRSPVLLVIAASVVIVVVRVADWPGDLLWFGSQFALAWAAGYALRLQLDRVARVSVDNAWREAELERAAQSALSDERARLAREIHDIIGHGLSLMVVHAGAAEQHVSDPVTVRSSLIAIQDVGRQAVTDMARLLQVLRSDHTEIGLGPQPGIAELDELCDSARQIGTSITLEVVGPVADVPATIGLTVYRVVQEALTNALRHAPGATVTVQLCSGPNELRLRVNNGPAGAARTPARPGSGHGLAGVTERVRLFNGTLNAGPDSNGGFNLVATIPLERNLGAE